MIVLQPSFYDAIAQSTIQHLKLFRVRVAKLFTIGQPPSQPSRAWSLRSLYLEVTPAMGRIQPDVSGLCTSILRLCAPSLRSLTSSTCRPKPIHTNGLGPSPRFPSLRHLRLGYLTLGDVFYLQELVHDELKALDVDTNSSPACSQFFDGRGRIPALEILVWSPFYLPESQSLAFLGANPHLLKLSIPTAASAALLEDRIVPMLAQSFSNLTSLSLVWDSLNIPCQALDYISQITKLEQLHFSGVCAGFQASWRHDWPIDHQAMQKYLRNLPLLKKLAFSRDSYSNGLTVSCERYYVDGTRGLEDVLNEHHTKEKFEEEHRKWIVEQANDYVKEMPNSNGFSSDKFPWLWKSVPRARRRLQDL